MVFQMLFFWKRIKFHLVQDFPDTLVLPPLAAKKLIPDWFKKIPPTNEDDLTVKKCVPFIDAMGAGYTILSHMDIVIYQTKEKEVRLWHTDDKLKDLYRRWPPIETHPNRQFPGSPMTGYTVCKYMSPWIIETAPGYSTIFLPPINRLEIPIVPLVGLVDTDTYFNNVNIPFIHTMLEPGGSKLIIHAGTPMCQIIPVRRDTWESKTTWLDKQELRKTKKKREEMQKDREDWYKNYAHVKKNYD